MDLALSLTRELLHRKGKLPLELQVWVKNENILIFFFFKSASQDDTIAAS